jgi:hypothetical protein
LMRIEREREREREATPRRDTIMVKPRITRTCWIS